MPNFVWDKSLDHYSEFPEIVNLLEKKYVPVCEATCQGSSNEKLSLVRQGECLQLWPYVYIQDSKTDRDTENNSTASLPCFLTLKPSTIKNAGRGIFTEIDLPAGLFFGPYEGYIVKYYYEISAYAWHIEGTNATTGEDIDYFVDGGDPRSSNWMRYVNTARFEEEQNMFAFIADFAVYYMIYKRIPANSELLTWYSPNYAEYLGMRYKEGKESVFHMIAPALEDVLPVLETNGEESPLEEEQEEEESVQEEERKEKENVPDEKKGHQKDKEL